MWGAIEADFHREYGIDLSAPGLLKARTWRWFLVRLNNLTGESSTAHQLNKNRKATKGGRATMDALGRAARSKE